MGVLAKAQLWGAEQRVSVRCDVRGKGEQGDKEDREREGKMSKRKKETDMGETGRQRERCTNQRANQAEGTYRELKTQTETETETQADRQRERESKMEETDEEVGRRRSQAYMRWVLSGVQSGRYLAPSSRALSRSSERKGFWKPLSTTTTPLRIFPSSCGPARGPLCSVPSPRGFPGTAPRAGAGTEVVAGVLVGAGTAEAKEQVQLALLGLNPWPLLPQIRSPSPQSSLLLGHRSIGPNGNKESNMLTFGSLADRW